MIDELPERWKRIYTAVGLLSVHWASVEYAIDHMVRSVHLEYGGGDRIPISFNNKPPYLRKAFRSHPDLIRFSPSLDELLTEASQIAEQRAWCLHGFLDIREAAPTFPITKIIHGPNYRKAKRPFSVKRIEALADRAMVLSVNLIFLGTECVWIEGQEEMSRIVREFVQRKGTTMPEGNLFGAKT